MKSLTKTTTIPFRFYQILLLKTFLCRQYAPFSISSLIISLSRLDCVLFIYVTVWLMMMNTFLLQVMELNEYKEVVDALPYSDASLEAAPFPKRFPFSCMVPRVYQEVRKYIEACLQFSQDLNLSAQEIDGTLRRYTNLLLTRTLNGCLSTLIRKPSLSLLQLIQISINTIHLEETNGSLEDFIAKLTG